MQIFFPDSAKLIGYLFLLLLQLLYAIVKSWVVFYQELNYFCFYYQHGKRKCYQLQKVMTFLPQLPSVPENCEQESNSLS